MCSSDLYFTEKLLDCFATGTIPVYLGAPDIDKHFNKDGIINLADEFYISEELYYSKMNAFCDSMSEINGIQFENNIFNMVANTAPR